MTKPPDRPVGAMPAFYREKALAALRKVERDLARATEPSPAQRYAIDYTLDLVRKELEAL